MKLDIVLGVVTFVPSGAQGKSTKSKEAELARKEAELKAKEAELKRWEADLKRLGVAGAAQELAALLPHHAP